MSWFNGSVSFDGSVLTLNVLSRSLVLDVDLARAVARPGQETAILDRLGTLWAQAAAEARFQTEELKALADLRSRLDTPRVMPTPAVVAAVVPTPPAVIATTATATGAAVRAIEGRRHHGGADAMEERVNALQSVVATLTGDLWMLIYDIPEVMNLEAPNPSRIFWGAGCFRLNKSCWVVPDRVLTGPAVREVLTHWESLPQTTVIVNARLSYRRSVGVRYYTIKYALDQLGTIRAIAEQMLQEELIRVHTALIERIGSADDRLREAEAEILRTSGGDKAMDAAAMRHDQSIRSALRDATDCFAGALASAQAFDNTDALADLFNGVRQAIRAEGIAFNVRMRAENRRPAPLPV